MGALWESNALLDGDPGAPLRCDVSTTNGHEKYKVELALVRLLVDTLAYDLGRVALRLLLVVGETDHPGLSGFWNSIRDEADHVVVSSNNASIHLRPMTRLQKG